MNIFDGLPEKKYNIIYADPPWQYRDMQKSCNRGAQYKYDVLPTYCLKSFPLEKISSDNCALFVWCTMPKLNKVFDAFERDGFIYKTVAFVWVKKTKKNTVFMGMGNYTRANAELCLLFIKGKLSVINHSIYQVVFWKRMEHSKKPGIIRDRIVDLFGDLPRIELFAREKVDNWDCWGNEI